MISLKLRAIREHNRIHSAILKVLWRLNGKKRARVYLFHDLKENLSDVKSQFAITQHSFEEFLTSELSKGAKAMSFAELTDCILHKSYDKNSFIVSFDDANDTVFTKAYPFLKKNNIPFIIFITKELIGKKGFLNGEQIEQLAKDELCTVGSHGLHHKMFRYYSSEETEKEWQESKNFLEEWLNVEVNSFAFPYGRVVECSKANIRNLKSAPYLFSFSAIAGTLGEAWFTGNNFLPRINVSEKHVKENM